MVNCRVNNTSFVTAQNKLLSKRSAIVLFSFAFSLSPNLIVSLQEAVRNAQEELAKQKEVIMAQDKELKVNTILPLI